MIAKADVRKQVRDTVASISAERFAVASVGITNAVLRAFEERGGWPSVVSAFVGVRGEPDTEQLITSLQAKGVTVALPRVTGPGTMVFHRLAAGGWEALEDAPFGLREPPQSWPVIAVEALDHVLVPGLAFAADGSRLGYGGGYYDRMLVGVDRPRRWGLCLREVMMGAPSWPVEAHDVAMGRVLTA